MYLAPTDNPLSEHPQELAATWEFQDTPNFADSLMVGFAALDCERRSSRENNREHVGLHVECIGYDAAGCTLSARCAPTSWTWSTIVSVIGLACSDAFRTRVVVVGHVVKDTTFEVPFDPPFVIAMKHLEWRSYISMSQRLDAHEVKMQLRKEPRQAIKSVCPHGHHSSTKNVFSVQEFEELAFCNIRSDGISPGSMLRRRRLWSRNSLGLHMPGACVQCNTLAHMHGRIPGWRSWLYCKWLCSGSLGSSSIQMTAEAETLPSSSTPCTEACEARKPALNQHRVSVHEARVKQLTLLRSELLARPLSMKKGESGLK